MHFSLFFSVIAAQCDTNSAQACCSLAPFSPPSSNPSFHLSLGSNFRKHSWLEFPPSWRRESIPPLFCLFPHFLLSQSLHPLTTSVSVYSFPSLLISLTAGFVFFLFLLCILFPPSTSLCFVLYVALLPHPPSLPPF